MNEKLELIRQKCIEANPEIAIPCDCPKGGIHINGARCYKCRGAEFVTRTIRLADVLLAASSLWYRDKDNHWVFFADEKQIVVGLCSSWNLRQDDLTKQKPETIDFIHQLLTT